MNLELRIPADKCSKRVLELVLTKIQNENLTVSEAFTQLLDQVADRTPTEPETEDSSSHAQSPNTDDRNDPH